MADLSGKDMQTIDTETKMTEFRGIKIETYDQMEEIT